MKIDLGMLLKVLANAAKDMLPIADAAKALGLHDPAKAIRTLAGEMPELKEIAKKVAAGTASTAETSRLHQALHRVLDARRASQALAIGILEFSPKPAEGMGKLEALRGARRAMNSAAANLLMQERIAEAEEVAGHFCEAEVGALFSDLLSRRPRREREQPVSA